MVCLDLAKARSPDFSKFLMTFLKTKRGKTKVSPDFGPQNHEKQPKITKVSFFLDFGGFFVVFLASLPFPAFSNSFFFLQFVCLIVSFFSQKKIGLPLVRAFATDQLDLGSDHRSVYIPQMDFTIPNFSMEELPSAVKNASRALPR